MELTLQESHQDVRRPPFQDSGYDISDVDLARIRLELDSYFASMSEFESMEPDQIFMRLSAYTARAGEVRLQLVRRDTRRATALRTREIDPFIEECDRQFRIWSRVQAVREMDLKLVAGQT